MVASVFDDKSSSVGVEELGAGIEAMGIVGDPDDVYVAVDAVRLADLARDQKIGNCQSTTSTITGPASRLAARASVRIERMMRPRRPMILPASSDATLTSKTVAPRSPSTSVISIASGSSRSHGPR